MTGERFDLFIREGDGTDSLKKIGSVQRGEQVTFEVDGGMLRSGTVRIKAVKCGKPKCSGCPHFQYAYARYREGKKVKEKYLGVVKG